MGQEAQSIGSIPACELVADAVRQGVLAGDLLANLFPPGLDGLSLCRIKEIARGNS
ncbi:hypothetical protein ATK86_5286 [Nocardia fluminea]|uniref:Uncharacterized protein n=1 Tax=Nocardia fluminea TaxID=134984 RepID=A0A2N3VGU9_9NOCA|nr:hypothetical protein ATK86_5286 [Nocardia fluminea]